jgi:hypothetical protein
MRIERLATSALFAAAVLTGCAGDDAPTAPALAVGDAGHNAADHFRTRTTVDFEIESPCNGEVIAFSGEEIDQMTFVGTREALDAGQDVHEEFQANVSATGTGPVSGATYAIHDVAHETFDSPSPPAPQFTFSFHETLHVTSGVPGLNFVFRQLIHLVKQPSADAFKVTQDVETAECRS